MYGLIGYPLSHSFSAKFFNDKFCREKINEEYRLFPIPKIDEIKGLFQKYPELKGLNVTIPYKSSIIEYLSDISPAANEIGAVNVIKIKEGKLKGYNTDAYGFKESLKPLLKKDIKKALILGTGGASKAVRYVLSSLGIDSKVVSRCSGKVDLMYSDLNSEIISENLLIVNTTPLGMYPDVNSFPDIPYQFIGENHICYDLVYNPEESRFLNMAESQGAVIKNGLEMLHLQAIKAWEIWNE